MYFLVYTLFVDVSILISASFVWKWQICTKFYVVYRQEINLTRNATRCNNCHDLLYVVYRQKINLTRNATRCNNRDDLLHISFTLRNSIFSEAYYNPAEPLWLNFYCENSNPMSIFTKKLHRKCLLCFYIRLCFRMLLKRLISLIKVFYFIKLLKTVIFLKYLFLSIHQTCY